MNASLLLFLVLSSLHSVSSPVPEIPPHVDSSSTGKFVIYQTDGSAIPSHPKVITADDVAQRGGGMGAKVVSYRKLQPNQPLVITANTSHLLCSTFQNNVLFVDAHVCLRVYAFRYCYGNDVTMVAKHICSFLCLLCPKEIMS